MMTKSSDFYGGWVTKYFLHIVQVLDDLLMIHNRNIKGKMKGGMWFQNQA